MLFEFVNGVLKITTDKAEDFPKLEHIKKLMQEKKLVGKIGAEIKEDGTILATAELDARKVLYYLLEKEWA